MYTGTLIEELMATVQRAEEHVRQHTDETELERWYATAHIASLQASLIEVA